MTTQLVSVIIDGFVAIAGGLLATMLGFRLLGPKPSVNVKYDELHSKWFKHLKWLGPLTIVFAILKVTFSLYA